MSGQRWHGLRVTMNCGHYALREVAPELVIGALTACFVCPQRVDEQTGVPTSRVRQIVDVAGVTTLAPPQPIDSKHWW